jgi:hypothetical protein
MAVRRQAWAWLVAICRRMNLSAEIVDVRGALCPPVAAGPATPIVRRMITDAGSPVRQKVDAAIAENRVETVTVDQWHITASPLTSGRHVVGALILARDLSLHSVVTPAKADPETWLVHAVEAHLLSDHPGETEPMSRLAEIHRAVHVAAERGLDRDVVLAFSEALAVHDECELRGFVEDADGRFILSVESRSGSSAAVPEILEDVAVLRDDELKRLSVEASRRLGFRSDRDVLMARVSQGISQPWIIVLSDNIESGRPSLLPLYLDILRQAMASAEHLAEAQLVRRISERLLGATDGPDVTAALEELTRSFDAVGAALVVTSNQGVPIFEAGDREVFNDVRPPMSACQLVAGIPLREQSASLGLRRPDGEPFTKYEQALFNRVTSLFAAWLPTALERSVSKRDRRSDDREFEHVIELTAARTIQDGAEVSALVIDLKKAKLRPGSLHRWAADLRGLLRASDVAGTLSDREIGVLLPRTGSVGAQAVGARIQERLESEADGLESAASVGLATLAPGSPPLRSIVQAARDDGARRARTDR